MKSPGPLRAGERTLGYKGRKAKRKADPSALPPHHAQNRRALGTPVTGLGMTALRFSVGWGGAGGGGAGLEEFEHGFGGVRQGLAAAVEQIQVAGHAELADFDLDEQALLDFPTHAHARHDGYADIHLHEALDAFDGGQLDVHAQRDVMFGEKLHDALAKRGFDDVGDEVFFA